MDIRTEFLAEIHRKPKLTKAYFLKLYAIELTWPGFADQALTELGKVGCSRAREYYQRFVGEYEQEHEKTMKNVAEWYRKQTQKKGVSNDRTESAERRKYQFDGLPQDW